MKQAPKWTEDEFRLLLANGTLTDEEVAKRVNRSPGAVAAVRVGVHRWQKGEDNKGFLSQMMLRVLNEDKRFRSMRQ